MRWAFSVSLLVAWTSWASRSGAAEGADGGGVGSYGRAIGDLDLALGAGAVAAPRGARGEVELRARYLESAGVFATYEDALIFGWPAEPGRVFAAGLELRPLYLYRWLQGQEWGDPRADLLADSIGLELGATWSQPAGQGLVQGGLQFGGGFEFPVLPQASGPWLGVHGGMRWSEGALASGQVHGADDRSVFLAFTLAWHQVLQTHLVDWKDELVR